MSDSKTCTDEILMIDTDCPDTSLIENDLKAKANSKGLYLSNSRLSILIPKEEAIDLAKYILEHLQPDKEEENERSHI